MASLGIPQNLEMALSTIFSNRFNAGYGGNRLQAGTPKGNGEGGSLFDTLDRLFAIQDRRNALGRQYGFLGGLAKGLSGGGGGAIKGNF